MKNLEKQNNLLLLLILVYGFFLRIQAFLTKTFAFTYDVGRDLLVLRDIALNHKIPLIGPTTGLHGLFYGPWWYYLLTPVFILSGGDPGWINVFMVLTGVVTIGLGYLLGKRIGGEVLGLLFASSIALSPALIGISSQIWNPYVAPPLVLAILLLVERVDYHSKKKNLFSVFLLGFVLAILLDIEVVFGLLFGLSMVIGVVLLFRRLITIKNSGVFILGVIAAELPKIIFEMRHNFLMTKTMLSVSQNSSANTVFSLSLDFGKRFVTFLDQWSGTLSGENQILGMVLLIFTVSIIFVYRKKLNNAEKRLYVLCAIIITTFFFGFTVFSQDIWSHYLVGLPIIYVLIFCLSLFVLFKQNKTHQTYILFGIIILLIFNRIPKNIFSNSSGKQRQDDIAAYKSQLAVVDYVYQQAKGQPFKYVVYTPPVHDYTYRYLFLWLGENKYHYLADPQARTAFFILEPDNQYPVRLQNWLRDRKNDGVVIKQTKLPTGIIIQTRVH